MADSISVTTNESTLQTQTATATIPTGTVVTGVSVNTGNVSYTPSGTTVNLTASGGSVSRTAQDSKNVEVDQPFSCKPTTEDFPDDYNYNKDGYTGKIGKYGDRYVVSGHPYGSITKPITVGPQSSSTFSDTYHYQKDADDYEGDLSKTGAATSTGTAADTKAINDYQPYANRTTSELPFPEGYCYGSDRYTGVLSLSTRVVGGSYDRKSITYPVGPQSSSSFPSTYSYNDGTYSGTLTASENPTPKTDSKEVTVKQPYSSKTTDQLPFPEGMCYNSDGYQGTLSKDYYVISGSASVSKTGSYTAGPQSSSSFPSTYNYDDGTYSGTLTAAANPDVTTDSKTVTVRQPYSSKTTDQLPFPEGMCYSSDGYQGTLSKNSYIISGSPAGSKNVAYTVGPQSTNNFSNYYSYNDGTYSGSLSKSGSPRVLSGSAPVSKTVTAKGPVTATSGGPMEYYYNQDGFSGTLTATGCNPVGGTPPNCNWQMSYSGTVYSSDSRTWVQDYSGTVSKPDTRVWQADYSGTVTKSTYRMSYSGTVRTKDTRVWQADYSGTVSKTGYIQNYSGTVQTSDTRVWGGFYSGNVTRPDTLMWTQSYQGVVTRTDTRMWQQNYAGAVYGPTTNYYKYVITVNYDYPDTTAPNITLSYKGMTVTANITDDKSGVNPNYTKWAKLPVQNDTYMKNNGTPFTNSFTVPSEGWYGVYAEDYAGNGTSQQIYVDPTPGKATIKINPDKYYENSSVTATFSSIYTGEGSITYQYKINGGDWVSCSGTKAFSDEGSYQLCARAVDSFGNISDISDTVSFVIDMTDTTINLSKDGFTINADIKDNLSGVNPNYTKWAKLPVVNNSFIRDNGTPFTNSFTVPSVGWYGVYAEDYAGNGTRADKEVTEDTPVISTSKINDNGWSNINVTVTSISITGYDYCEYSLDGGSWTQFDKAFDITTEGNHTITARGVKVINGVKNYSLQSSISFGIDMTKPNPPIITTSLILKNGWYNGESNFYFNSTDNKNGSGVKSYTYQIDNGDLVPCDGKDKLCVEGKHTIRAKAIDFADNYSDFCSDMSLNFDVTPPTIKLTQNRQKVNTLITDNLSGVDTDSVVFMKDDGKIPTDFKDACAYISAHGTKFTNSFDIVESGLYYVFASDFAGNGNDSSVQITDITPPIIDLTQHTGTVSVSISEQSSIITTLWIAGKYETADNFNVATGIKIIVSNNKFIVPATGFYTVFAEDCYHNKGVKSIYVDLTPPTKPSLFTLNRTGWGKDNIVISQISGSTDTDSELYGYQYQVDNGDWLSYPGTPITEEGWHTINARAIDNVGNVSDTVSQTAGIDITSPTVPVISNNVDIHNGWYNGEAVLHLSSTDNGSGVKEYQYKINNGEIISIIDNVIKYQPEGAFSIIACAVDYAGNTSNFTKEFPLCIDVTPPTVNLTQNGQKINAVITDNLSGVDTDSVVWMKDDGKIPTDHKEACTYISAHGTKFTDSFVVTDSGTYYVFASDFAGNGNYNKILVTVNPIVINLLAKENVITANMTDSAGTISTKKWIEKEVKTPEDFNSEAGSNVFTGDSFTVKDAGTVYTVYAEDGTNKAVKSIFVPAPPKNLRLKLITDSSVTLNWDNPYTDCTPGYKIFKDSNEIHITGDLEYTDNGLRQNTDYVYTVETVDPVGNISIASAPLKVTTVINKKIFFGDDGVHTPTGNFCASFSDMSVSAPGLSVDISRTYNSMNDRIGLFGRGWTFSYEANIEDYSYDYLNPDGTVTTFKKPNTKIINMPDGSAFVFEMQNDQYVALDSHSSLTASGNEFILVTKDQTEYRFNANSKLYRISDKNGNAITLTFDTNGRIQTIKDPVAREFSIEYNSDGLISKITDPINRSVSYTYTSGNLTGFKDPKDCHDGASNTVQYGYDGSNFLNTVIDGLGNTVLTLSYIHAAGADNGKVQNMKDLNGSFTYTYYNAFRSVTTTNNTLQYQVDNYNSNLLICNYTDKNNETTYIEYNNSFGDVSTVHYHDASYEAYDLDGNGNVLAKRDQLGNETDYSYDGSNNLLSEIDTKTGDATFYKYDGNGNMTYKAVRLTGCTDTSYNPGSNDSSFSVTHYVYNSNGTVSQVTYPDKRQTSYQYDSYGNAEVTTDSDSGEVHSIYNEIGWLLKSYKLNNGNETDVTRTTHDLDGRVLQQINNDYYNPNDDSLSTDGYKANVGDVYTYDRNGRILTHTNPDGAQTTFCYDYGSDGSFGYTSSATQPSGAIFRYDKTGKLVSEDYPDGRKLEAGFDSKDRMTDKAASDGKNGEHFDYNDKNDIAGYAHTVNGYKTSFSFITDDKGNITHLTEGSTAEAGYAYDSNTNALLREDNSYIGKTFTYDYDNYGNILHKKEYAYTTAAPGTPTADHSFAYSAGAYGKLMSFDGNSISYDAAGRLKNDSTWDYFWDDDNKLRRMSKDGTTITYDYNADGIRTMKKVNNVTTTYKLYGTQILSETVFNADTNKTSVIKFYYDSNGNPVYMDYDGAISYYCRNLQGDIVGLVDTTGINVVKYTYDAWGKLDSISGPLASTLGLANPLRYRGYCYDDETGLYYLNSRYYNPTWCRFISEDIAEMQPAAGDTVSGNLYAYCNNSPVMGNDSNGCFAVRTWIVGAALDILFTVLNAAMESGFLAYSATIRLLSRSRFTIKFAEKLLIGTVEKCFVYGILNPIMTLIRKAVWRITGAAIYFLSARAMDRAVSFFNNHILSFISSVSSWGSFISTMLDYMSDRKMNGWIRW